MCKTFEAQKATIHILPPKNVWSSAAAANSGIFFALWRTMGKLKRCNYCGGQPVVAAYLLRDIATARKLLTF